MAVRPDSPYSPVQSAVPDVQAPNDYIRSEATPGDMGAQIGNAVQQLGQTGQRLGAEATEWATQQQGLYNKTAVDSGFNQQQQYVNRLLYGDPADPGDHGYLSLSGADAMNARAGVMQQIESHRQQISDGMNGAQRVQFEDASRRLTTAVEAQVGSHATQQFQTWTRSTQLARADTALQTLSADPGNDDTFTRNVSIGMQAIAHNNELAGMSPDASLAAIVQYKSKAYATRATAMAATDPVGALNFLTANRTELDGVTFAHIYETLTPKVNALKAQGIVDTVAPITGTSGLGPASGAVQTAAVTAGVDPVAAQTVAHLESNGGAAKDRYGSTHTGVFQMGDAEFAQNNPTGQRGDVNDEATAGVNNLARIQPIADKAVGGTAAPWQVYMVHQQGDAGGAALLKANPNQNAVDALAPAYNGNRDAASAAISGNGGNPDGTVGQFLSRWQGRYAEAEARVKAAGGAAGPAPFPDTANMEQQILDQTRGDPELQKVALSQLHARLGIIGAQRQQQRDGLTHDLSVTNNALLEGDPSAVIPETRIRSVFPPDEAQQKINDLQTSKAAGQIMSTVKLATPEQLADTVSDLSDPNGKVGVLLRLQTSKPITLLGGAPTGAADLAPENAEQRLNREAILGVVQKQIAARGTALRTDPAGYVATNDPTVTAALKAIDPKDPTTFEAYARETAASQKNLGVAASDTRVLTPDRSQAIAKQLISGDPATTDVGGQLDALSKQYGNAWPAVWHDLVRDGHMPAEWQVLGAMPSGPDRMQMQRALQVAEKKGGVENMRKDIDPASAQNIDRGLDVALDDFRKTVMIPGLAGNADLFSTVRSAVRTSAFYGTMAGQNGSDALDRAVKGALPYDFVGLARAPKGTGGQAESYGANLLSGLTAGSIGTVKTGNPDMLPGQTQEAYTAAVKRSGVWVTNERDDGWTLAVPNRMGGYQLVTGPKGQRIGFKFSDMAKGVPAAQPQTAELNAAPGVM